MGKILAVIALMFSLGYGVVAQTVTVQLVTDEPTPQDFSEAEDLGSLTNGSYSYSSKFLIKVSYDLSLLTFLSFSLSGSQADYDLVWRADGGINQPFINNLGASVFSLLGSANNRYYKNTGFLVSNPANATSYEIGVLASPNVAEDLNVLITLTVTVN